MHERRQSKRIPVTLELMISDLFIQDNDKIKMDSPIIVKDVSDMVSDLYRNLLFR